jgi:hypothetical protein
MIALSDMQSYFCRSHTQSETPSSLSLPFPVLGDSCPTRAEAGQAGIGIYPARRYCSPSQRLPPSGLILIYSTRLHPSHIIVIGSAFTTTTCIPTVKHTPKAARVKSHQIGFKLYLGIAILRCLKWKEAFSHWHIRQHTYVYIPALLPSLESPSATRQSNVYPGQTQTVHVN